MPRTRQETPPDGLCALRQALRNVEALPRYGYGSQHSLMVIARERDSHYRIEAAHRDFEASEVVRVAALCARMENQQKNS
jgi:Ser/Thr protein kinase RdoA (MazF antagonist)